LLAGIEDFYQRVFWSSPVAACRAGNGYELHYSGYPFLTGANQLCIKNVEAFSGLWLEDAARFFRAFGAEWSLVVLPPEQPELLEQALSCGGFVRWQNPLMVLKGAPRSRRIFPSIEIRPVETSSMYATANRVMEEAFLLEPHISALMIHPADGLRNYLAYWDGRPVAIGTLSLTGSLAGVWNIGTRRAFRRQGIAYAIMMHICAEAEEQGAEGTFLLASPEGRYLYDQIGYSTATEVYYVGFPLI
jgi:GNAT superfamily N-acetyltransferase